MKIYLDMDGVLCDFDGRFFELYGEHPRQAHSKKRFWERWDDFVFGGNFATLPRHRDCDLILQTVRALNVPVEVLTSSGSGGHTHNLVVSQKTIWLKNNGIEYPINVVPGGVYKARFATPYSILVDDMKKNVNAFREAGGKVILHKNVSDTITQLYDFYEENQ